MCLSFFLQIALCDLRKQDYGLIQTRFLLKGKRGQCCKYFWVFFLRIYLPCLFFKTTIFQIKINKQVQNWACAGVNGAGRHRLHSKNVKMIHRGKVQSQGSIMVFISFCCICHSCFWQPNNLKTIFQGSSVLFSLCLGVFDFTTMVSCLAFKACLSIFLFKDEMQPNQYRWTNTLSCSLLKTFRLPLSRVRYLKAKKCLIHPSGPEVQMDNSAWTLQLARVSCMELGPVMFSCLIMESVFGKRGMKVWWDEEGKWGICYEINLDALTDTGRAALSPCMWIIQRPCGETHCKTKSACVTG